MVASKKHDLCRDKFSQNAKNTYTENYNILLKKMKKKINAEMCHIHGKKIVY